MRNDDEAQKSSRLARFARWYSESSRGPRWVLSASFLLFAGGGFMEILSSAKLSPVNPFEPEIAQLQNMEHQEGLINYLNAQSNITWIWGALSSTLLTTASLPMFLGAALALADVGLDYLDARTRGGLTKMLQWGFGWAVTNLLTASANLVFSSRELDQYRGARRVAVEEILDDQTVSLESDACTFRQMAEGNTAHCHSAVDPVHIGIELPRAIAARAGSLNIPTLSFIGDRPDNFATIFLLFQTVFMLAFVFRIGRCFPRSERGEQRPLLGNIQAPPPEAPAPDRRCRCVML